MNRRELVFAAPFLATAGVLPRRARATERRVLRFGAPFPSGSSLHQGMVRFKEVVEAGSDGRLQVDLFPDAKLGDISGLLQRLGEASIDIALLGIGTAADLPGGRPLNLGFVPYLFKDRQWAATVCNGPIFQQIFDSFAATSGIRIFAARGERLPRAYQTTCGPVIVPADLRGMRIRVAPISVFIEGTKAMGAIPVAADINVTYEAFVKGQIDGQENGIELAVPLRLYEVAKFFSEVDFAPSLATWYAPEPVWRSLGPDDRDLLLLAADAGGEVITRQSRAMSISGIATLRREGVLISEPNAAAFRAVLGDIYKLYEGQAWPDGLVGRIRAMQT